MPIYEYDCKDCGRIEVIQKFSDEPLTVCPLCAEKGIENSVSRVVSLSSFHLKGSGWYQTDYHGKNSCSSGEHSASSANTATESNKATTTTETKAATKTETPAATSSTSTTTAA